MCMPIEATLPTGVWDHFRPGFGTTGPKPRLNPASGGSYGIWDHSPCVWFCLCGPIEVTLPTGVWDHRLPTGVWDQQRSRCEAHGCEAWGCDVRRYEACRCEARRCEACRCEARRCEARRCEARRCEARRCEARTLPLCVVLLAHLALAPSPSRPLGAGRRGGELHTQPPRPPTPPPSLLSVLRTGVLYISE